MKHSKIGASSAGRWTKCPGSVALCASLPKQDPGPYAAEGTLAHKLAEDLLKEKVLNGTYSVEMVDYVDVYVDAVDECLNAGPARELYVEQSFKLDWLYPGMWGTNDACVAEALGTLYVWDLKYGAGVVVEVENNPQLMYYGLGALKEYPYDFDKVCLGIVQPRAFHPKGPVRTWTISVKELMAWGETVLKPAAIAANKKNAPLVPGDWCKNYFCPGGKAYKKNGKTYPPPCPAFKQKALEMARAEFDTPLNEITLPAPKDLSPAEIVRVMEFADLISNWAKEVKACATGQLEEGKDLPGYKLVDSYGNRAWRNKEAAEKYFNYLFGSEIYDKPKFKSPAEIEKMPCEDKKVLKELVKEHVHKPYKGRVIAPESDKRPASQGTAAIDFKDD